MIGIYKITSPSKKVYIGQSVDIENRFYSYRKLYCKKQPILYRSLLKYGVEKHNFEILCECDVNELNEKERYYQDLYCVLNKSGLNCILTKASDRSGTISDETRKKLSEAKIGKKKSIETKSKMSAWQIGRKLTDEHKQKLSAWQIGRKLTNEHKQKLSNAKLGKKKSDETKSRMSSGRKGMKFTDEHKKNISNARKKIKISDETRKKMSASRKKNIEEKKLLSNKNY